MASEYEQQAQDFLAKTGTTFSTKFLRHAPYFDDDQPRDVYEVTLTKGARSYTFTFGQSVANSGHRVLNAAGKEMKFGWDNTNRNTQRFRAEATNHFGTLRGLTVKEPVAPTAYDVLASLTKNEVGSFKDFCADFGFDEDSRKAEKMYNAVKDEYNNVARLYTEEELDLMREIA